MPSFLDTGLLASDGAMPFALFTGMHSVLCVLGGIACLVIPQTILFLVRRRVPQGVDFAVVLLCIFIALVGVIFLSAAALPRELLAALPFITSVRLIASAVAAFLCALMVREVLRAAKEPTAAQYQRTLEQEVESRRAAEACLRRNESRYRSLIDASCSLVWVTDRTGEFIVDGGTFEIMAGLADGPNTPIGWRQIVHEDDAQSFETRWKAGIASGRSFESEARFASAEQDGYRMCLVRAAPVLADDGHVVEWVASLRDVEDLRQGERERKDIEHRARESQHFESLGVLAGGVAHDFNNLLVGVMGHAELISKRIDRGSPVQENARCIVDSAERAAQLCKKMLAFAGKGRFLPERCQLSIVVRNAQRTLTENMPKNVRLLFEYDAHGPSIDINPEELRQLLHIFVNNSVEAIDGRSGGIVQVTTGSRFFTAEELAQTKLGSACFEGEYAFLEVSDNGSGIPAEIMPRIFDPFFSTKFVGRGLSLAAALGIARTHSGTVHIVSRPGATCARLLLPVLTTDVQHSGVRLSAVGRKVQGTVLVVDDDADVRDLARLTIEDIGAQVLIACSGSEAVQIYRERHAQIDLVLLDLTMPNMDGATALKHLREIEPSVRVILSSGYLAADAIERIGDTGVEGFVQKPWRPSTLAERMMNALTQATRRARLSDLS